MLQEIVLEDKENFVPLEVCGSIRQVLRLHYIILGQ